MSELFSIIKESSDSSPVIVVESPKKTKKEKVIKPVNVDKSLEYLMNTVEKKMEEKKANTPVKQKSEAALAREALKAEKEKQKLAKKELNNCKGKTKDNKECSRKEVENCDGFCKQHFVLEKERANTVELIEKHKKI